MFLVEGGGEDGYGWGSRGIPKLPLGVGANWDLVWRLRGISRGWRVRGWKKSERT
jgi:hypothetical protein